MLVAHFLVSLILLNIFEFKVTVKCLGGLCLIVIRLNNYVLRFKHICASFSGLILIYALLFFQDFDALTFEGVVKMQENK